MPPGKRMNTVFQYFPLVINTTKSQLSLRYSVDTLLLGAQHSLLPVHHLSFETLLILLHHQIPLCASSNALGAIADCSIGELDAVALCS